MASVPQKCSAVRCSATVSHVPNSWMAACYVFRWLCGQDPNLAGAPTTPDAESKEQVGSSQDGRSLVA